MQSIENINQYELSKSQNKVNTSGWLIISVCSLFLFFKYILQVFPSIMTGELMEIFATGGNGLGKLAAAFFYGYLLTQFFVGVILDCFNIRTIAAMAIIVASVGLLGFTWSTNLFAAEATRFFMGAGAAFATVTYMKLASVCFKSSQFAFVGGLLATATMAGAVFGQAPLSFAVHQIGWKASLQWCSVFGLIIAGLFLLFVKTTSTNNKQRSANTANLRAIKQVFTSKQNWLLTLYGGFTFAPIAVFGGLWGPSYIAEAYQLSNTHAAFIVSFLFIGLAFGGPIVGWWSDRIGKRKQLMVYGIVLSLCITVAVIYYNHFNLIILSTLMFIDGFVTGGYMLGFVIGRESNPLLVSATVVAMINSGDAILGALTEPFIGWLLDINASVPNHFTVSNYVAALSILPMFYLAALFFVSKIKESELNHE